MYEYVLYAQLGMTFYTSNGITGPKHSFLHPQHTCSYLFSGHTSGILNWIPEILSNGLLDMRDLRELSDIVQISAL